MILLNMSLYLFIQKVMYDLQKSQATPEVTQKRNTEDLFATDATRSWEICGTILQVVFSVVLVVMDCESECFVVLWCVCSGGRF